MNTRSMQTLAMAATLALAACSGDGGDGTADAARDGGADGRAEGGACTGSLEDVNTSWQTLAPCPASADEARVRACIGGPSRETITVRECAGTVTLWHRYAFLGRMCVYDASTAQLVGAQKSDDVPSFCERTSATIEAGDVARACSEAASAVRMDACEGTDGGSDGGDDASADDAASTDGM